MKINGNTATIDGSEIGCTGVYEVDFIVAEPFRDGKYFGPPEDCYPEEGYCEPLRVRLNGVEVEGCELEGLMIGMIENEIRNGEPGFEPPDFDYPDNYYY